METYQQAVNQQYGSIKDIGSRVLAALRNAGKDTDHLTRGDFETFDQLHIGGIAETRSMAQRAGLREGTHVLDVGSGIGGPARALAAEFGCRVTGLDLTEEFCRVAEMLTERVGLGDKIEFHHGSALDMPFEDNSFDALWTQFACMNIGDKEKLYAEFRRVLRPGGVLALNEIMAGSGEPLHYPLLWADEPSISFLRPPEAIRALLESNGFEVVVWDDMTQRSLEWFKAMQAARAAAQKPVVTFDVFADSIPQKSANVARSLQEGRITVVQAVLRLND